MTKSEMILIRKEIDEQIEDFRVNKFTEWMEDTTNDTSEIGLINKKYQSEDDLRMICIESILGEIERLQNYRRDLVPIYKYLNGHYQRRNKYTFNDDQDIINSISNGYGQDSGYGD